MPFLLSAQNAAGGVVRGREAFAVLVTTVPDINEIQPLDNLVCFSWLGSVPERQAIAQRREVVVAAVLAAVAAKAAPVVPAAAGAKAAPVAKAGKAAGAKAAPVAKAGAA